MQLPCYLYRLLKDATHRLDEHRRNISFETETHQIPVVEEFNYKGDDHERGNLGLTWRLHLEERSYWRRKDREKFLDDHICGLTAYKHSVESMRSVYGMDEKQADQLLRQLIRTIVSRPEGDNSEESLVNDVAVFLRDLDKAPRQWTLTIWLDGLWLPDDDDKVHTLTEGTTLRRPTPRDLEQKRRKTALFGIADALNEDNPRAVLETHIRAASQREVQEAVDPFLEVFRLFRVGSVRHVRYTMWTETFDNWLGPAGQFLMRRTHASAYKYKFTTADVDQFNAFYSAVFPLLTSDILHPSSVEPVGIALQRYRDALLLIGPSIENRVALAVSCLEALSLKAKERSELSHRLGQRTAALVRCVGIDPSSAYNELKEAYEVRSAFVHGAATSKKPQQVRELASRVLDYARIALCVAVQLTSHGTSKSRLVSMLDRSLLKDDARDELQRKIRESVIPIAEDE